MILGLYGRLQADPYDANTQRDSEDALNHKVREFQS